jgi:hypothetical protein
MLRPVDTKVPSAVEEQVGTIYLSLFPSGHRDFVSRAFAWGDLCFTGKHPDYQAIDAKYHDFEHTLQGTLCLARLLEGRHKAGAEPPLGQKLFELGLLAILFHDTGYLKKADDTEGTGAKYTLIHVGRSAAFAREFLSRKGMAESDLNAIQNMIRCTGVNAAVQTIPFQSGLEQLVGFALGTADLLGQMAAEDYVDKLPVLYQEFAEASRHEGGVQTHYSDLKSARELLRNSPSFWTDYVRPRIRDDFKGLYRYLNDPYPDGPNPYILAVEKNVAKIQDMLKATGG